MSLFLIHEINIVQIFCNVEKRSSYLSTYHPSLCWNVILKLSCSLFIPSPDHFHHHHMCKNGLGDSTRLLSHPVCKVLAGIGITSGLRRATWDPHLVVEHKQKVRIHLEAPPLLRSAQQWTFETSLLNAWARFPSNTSGRIHKHKM